MTIASKKYPVRGVPHGPRHCVPETLASYVTRIIRMTLVGTIDALSKFK